MATAAAMTAMASTITGQMKADEIACKRRLNAASLKCIAMGIKRDEITLHCLPASGGASGAPLLCLATCSLLSVYRCRFHLGPERKVRTVMFIHVSRLSCGPSEPT
jgi:hypothetical protein